MSDRTYARTLEGRPSGSRRDLRRRIGVAALIAATAGLLVTQLPAAAANTGAGSPPAPLGHDRNAQVGVPGTGSGVTTPTTPPPTPTTAPPAPTTTTVPAPTTTTTTTTTTTAPTPRRGGTAGGQTPSPSSPSAPTTTTTTVPAPTTTTTAAPPPPTNAAALNPSATSAASASPNGCQPDPAATIAALPAGGVFHGSGCYTTHGILLTKPVTIDGGTYNDPIDSNPGGVGDGLVPAIMRVKNTSNVTIENVILNGANPVGGFHRRLVGAAGLDILSSDHVTILNSATNNTFGDGLTLFADFSIDGHPVTNLLVNGLTITNAGRQGITVGYAENSVLDNVHLVSSADTGWDFESDLPRVGSANVVINNAVDDQKGVHIIEALKGPITFNDCHFTAYATLENDAARSHQLVTYNGGSWALERRTTRHVNIAGINVAGPGRMVMNHVHITRMPGAYDAPIGPSISVTNGGNLTLIGSPVPAPVGTHDASSTVTILP